MLKNEEDVRTLLDSTTLSIRAKEALTRSCMENVRLLEAHERITNGGKGAFHPRNKRYGVSLFLACDKHTCAIPRKLVNSKVPLHNLAEARTITGISTVILPSERIAALMTLLSIPNNVKEKANELVKYELQFESASPTITATALICIAAQLCEYPLEKKRICAMTGVSILALFNRISQLLRYADINQY